MSSIVLGGRRRLPEGAHEHRQRQLALDDDGDRSGFMSFDIAMGSTGSYRCCGRSRRSVERGGDVEDSPEVGGDNGDGRDPFVALGKKKAIKAK